jgi:glycosyltransferase involved in cell wall biosynthesis
VVHFEGQTSGTDLTQGIKRHQVRNQAVFEERWRTVLAHHPTHDGDHRRAVQANATRRVMVIDVCVPRPDHDSGSLRMFEMLRALRKLGCAVSFVPDNGYLPQPYVQHLQSLGVELLHAPHFDAFEKSARMVLPPYDTVIVSRAAVAAKYVDWVRARQPGARLVYDTVDLHFLRMQREAELGGGALANAASEHMKATELGLIAKADITLVVSPFESALLAKEAPNANVLELTNIHECDPGPASFAQRQGVVFIGGFMHPPNVDAVTWYAKAVLPILRELAPGLTTVVVGPDAPLSLQALGSAELVFTGFVADAKAVFNASRVAISPLRYGAGVKGKVNLAMQYGVPVVATSCSIEGMHLASGRDVIVADDPRSFAEAIVNVHNDAIRWQQLRDAGLNNIQQHFSRARALDVLREIVNL